MATKQEEMTSVGEGVTRDEEERVIGLSETHLAKTEDRKKPPKVRPESESKGSKDAFNRVFGIPPDAE